MNNQYVIDLHLGFESMPHFTISVSILLDLGRNRHLSYGCVGTPYEMICICCTNSDNDKEIIDIITIHN